MHNQLQQNFAHVTTVQLQQNFAHVTTVTLLWRVQNIVVIGTVHIKPEHCKFWSNFEFECPVKITYTIVFAIIYALNMQ